MEIRQPAPGPSNGSKPSVNADPIAEAKADLERVLRSRGARKKLRNATAQINAFREDK